MPFFILVYADNTTECIGGCIVASVAYRPEGPWSETKIVMAPNERPYTKLVLYTPVVQPKFSAPDYEWMTIMFTGSEVGAGNILQSINVVSRSNASCSTRG